MRTSIEVLRPGRFTAADGQEVSFTAADISAIAAVYDPMVFEAPLVVGHPQVDAPAYGWVESLETSDNTLRAMPRDVDTAFAEIVNAGRYRKVSASLFTPDSKSNPKPGSYYLRHVGFLGAAAPAVSGLRPVSLDAGGGGIITLGDDEAELVSREKRLAERERALRAEECRDFVAGLVREGRVGPGLAPGLAAFLSGTDDTGSVEFTAPGSEEIQSIGRRTWLEGFLQSLPVQIHFREFSAPGRDDPSDSIAPAGYVVDHRGMSLHREALRYQRETGVSFSDAVKVVSGNR